MFSLFKKNNTVQVLPVLPILDSTLYPIQWQQHTFASAYEIIFFITQNTTNRVSDYQLEFSRILQNNPVYQDWVNFTVFGRYVQRSFSAFYQQNEDIFNADMPDLLRHELMRHTQLMPIGQVLLVGGDIPASARQEKLLITTLNPFKAVKDALGISSNTKSKQVKTIHSLATSQNHIVLNLITATSTKVKAFAVKHNKRTRDSLRNEVMILDFNGLTLIKEETSKNNTQTDNLYLIRHYTIY